MTNKSYFGNCTQDDVIEHIFGDVSIFAQHVDEHGDNSEYEQYTITYDQETDIHTFWY